VAKAAQGEKTMKWILLVLGVVILLVAITYVIGMLLPVAHVASVRAQIARPPQEVFSVLENVSASAGWRSEVESVSVLSAPSEPLRWEEVGSFGKIRFVREESTPGSRTIARIDGTDQGFGGRWIYEVAPTKAGSVVTITEEGEVYNPMFRFLSRFVFGHHGTMETYLRDLGGRFGEETRTERVQ
jgi:hypothetical protein